MKVVFRTDASLAIGTGHVMRCLTLADSLREKGADMEFVCREHPGHLCGLIESAGYRANRLPAPGESRAPGFLRHSDWLGVSQDVDAQDTRSILGKGRRFEWMVVDHYALDKTWESAMRSMADRVMVIDDLADRTHDCDLLLDQNYYRDPEPRYDGLVPPSCRRLLGPKYALLRAEFVELRGKLRERDGVVRRILVFFGGIDSGNETAKAIHALMALNRPDIEVDVVVGEGNPNRDEIARMCSTNRSFEFHCQISNLAELMADADLAIGAGGVALWERSCLGLPAIVVSIADNQRPGSEAFAGAGGISYLGESQSVSMEVLGDTIGLLVSSPHLLKTMSRCGIEWVDGRGTQRTARWLFGAPMALRGVTEADCEPVFRWRNDEETRRFSGDGTPIPFDDHVRWFKNTLIDPDRSLLIAELDGRAVGVLRYDRADGRAVVSVYLVPGNGGKGLGAILIEEGTRWVKSNWPEVDAIDAKIQPDNLASIAAFEAAGFRKERHVHSKIIRN